MGIPVRWSVRTWRKKKKKRKKRNRELNMDRCKCEKEKEDDRNAHFKEKRRITRYSQNNMDKSRT
jgi:hypothetical protein